MRGGPTRIEIGRRDIEAGQVTIVRRDTLEKSTAPLEGIAQTMAAFMDSVHEGLFNQALARREERTATATNFDELAEGVKSGFVRGMWCGERECEDMVKEKTGATTRCMPFDEAPVGDVCCACGKPAKKLMIYAKAY